MEMDIAILLFTPPSFILPYPSYFRIFPLFIYIFSIKIEQTNIIFFYGHFTSYMHLCLLFSFSLPIPSFNFSYSLSVSLLCHDVYVLVFCLYYVCCSSLLFFLLNQGHDCILRMYIVECQRFFKAAY